jgi:hypothetical protein
MGTIILKAIVVTADETDINKAHALAVEHLKELVSPIVYGTTNGYASFFIAPEGSKLGWSTHEEANSKRAAFLEDIKTQNYFVDVVHVQYGETTPAILED